MFQRKDIMVLVKVKKSGEYTKPKTRKGGERGGKGRHHRGNGNKGKKEN